MQRVSSSERCYVSMCCCYVYALLLFTEKMYLLPSLSFFLGDYCEHVLEPRLRSKYIYLQPSFYNTFFKKRFNEINKFLNGTYVILNVQGKVK